MTRIALLIGLVLSIGGAATAEPQGGPRTGHFSQADLDWARALSAATPLPADPGWEGSNASFEASLSTEGGLGRASTNNDTAHYALNMTESEHLLISYK